jgi:O-antigen/teichoic acid export membrane protein
LVIAYALSAGFTLLWNIVLARSLGAARYGSFAIVLSLVTSAQMLFSSRVWETVTTFVVRFVGEGNPRRATSTIKLCLLVDVIGALIAFGLMVAIADAAVRAFGLPSAAGPLRYAAFAIVLGAPAATAASVVRLGDRFAWLAAHTIADNLARLLGISIALSLAGPSLRAVVLGYLAAAAISTGALVGLARVAARGLGLAPWRDGPLSALTGEWRRILGFLAYSNVAGTARLLSGRVDVLVVGWFTDPSSVAVYRLARTVADPLAGVATPVSNAIFPEVSRLVHAGDERAIERLTRSFRDLAVVVVLPVCVVTTLSAGWLIPSVFGSGFAAAVPLTQIMVWQLVWVPYLWLPGLLLSLGRSRLVAAVTLVDSAGYLAALLVLVPTFGVIGAAWATLVRFVAWTLAASAIAERTRPRLTEASV